MSKVEHSDPPPGYSPSHTAGTSQAPYPTMPPPPPGYAAPGQTVVVTQPGMIGMVAPHSFHETPVTMTCPHCQARITTSTHYKVGTMTWVSSGIICLIGMGLPCLWLGCCFIPFCINALKDVIHQCPNCQREVGRFNRG